MSEAEAREFWAQDLGFGPGHSLRPADVERAIEAAGLQLLRRVDFGGEWGEYHQERNGPPGRRLLHASRLLRDPRRYVEQFATDDKVVIEYPEAAHTLEFEADPNPFIDDIRSWLDRHSPVS